MRVCTLTIEEWKAAQGTKKVNVISMTFADQRDTAYPRRVERFCQASRARLISTRVGRSEFEIVCEPDASE